MDNIDNSDNKDMAQVATMPPPTNTAATSPTTTSAAANRRYRPAPAKTFQCRGYGDCRMVFSRSEHLARHIRKHTGERPFTCHCGKQFSRLDNLRQHAQTVHADKQDQNERMMQELTSLHASMTAASKGGQSRGKRGAAALAAASAANPNASAGLDGSIPTMSIKQEDPLISSTIHPRPGTSTGYEDGNGLIYHPQWDRSVNLRDSTRHSFRDSIQSFRAPHSAATSSSTQHPGQSFLVPSSTPFKFSLPDISDSSPSTTRPGSSSTANRPTSSSAAAASDSGRSLPPISSIVPASLPFPPQSASTAAPPYPSLRLPHEQPGSGKTPSFTSTHILPLPTPSYPRRPTTANRPGTAPASFYYSTTHAFPPGSGNSLLGPAAASREQHRPELSLSFLSGRSAAAATESLYARPHFDAGDEPTSPNNYESPFSFHAPAAAATTQVSDYSGSLPNPRKRPHSGSDDDDNPRHPGRSDVRPISSSSRRPGTNSGLYDYGSESRPQSRRLSVMELCNNSPSPDISDDAAAERDSDPAPARSFVSFSTAAAATGSSRPTTSSGLVTSASQLALVDRPTPPPPSAYPTAAAAAASPASSHSYLSRSSSPEQRRPSPTLLVRAPHAATGANASAARADTPPRGTAAATSGARTSEFSRGIPSSSSISWGFSSTQQQSQPHFAQSSQHGLYSAPTSAAYNHYSRSGGHVYYGSPPSSPPVGRYASSQSQSTSSPYGRSHHHHNPNSAAAGLSVASPVLSDVGSPSSSSSAGSPGGGGGSLSGRRSAAGSPGGDDQVRFATVVGMRA